VETTVKETPVDEPASINVFEFRKMARRRALLCPGAGWAYLSRPGLARLTFGTTLAMLLVASWTAWRPTGASAWTTLALLAASIGLIVVELFQTFIVWPAARSSADVVSSKGGRHLAGAVILTAAAVLLGALIATSYRPLVIQGDAMVPTVSNGDKLYFRKGVDRTDLKPGKLILFTCSPNSIMTTPDEYMLGRIIAMPGDAIETREGIYYVNDVSVRRAGSRGQDQPALIIPEATRKVGGREPPPARVPIDKYFIVQDSIEGGRDSRVLSWVELENIKSTELFSFQRGWLPRRVE
jgi:signal peptidase I